MSLNNLNRNFLEQNCYSNRRVPAPWLLLLELLYNFSCRFMEMFPDTDDIQNMQQELDHVIHAGIVNINELLKNSETERSTGTSDVDDFELNVKKQRSKNSLSFEASGIGDESDSGNDLSIKDQFQNAKLQQKLQARRHNLSDELLRSGVLTRTMFRKLKEEFAKKSARSHPKPWTKQR